MAQATLHQEANGHWTYVFEHESGARHEGGGCSFDAALSGLGRAYNEATAKAAAKASGHACRFCGEEEKRQ
jgi:hypothetical protein